MQTPEGLAGNCPALGMLLGSLKPSWSPRSVCRSSRPRSQHRQGGQDQPSCLRCGWPGASASLTLSLALQCRTGPAAPCSLAASREVAGLGCAPVPVQGGGAGGGRDPMGFLRKASLCDTFPSFYGVVLFMAKEGNEQLARQAKANTAAAEQPSGLAGALLGGGGAGGGGTGALLPSGVP